MTTSSRTRVQAIALALTLGTVIRPSAAQSQDEAAARTLFLDGRRLLKEGRAEEACQKFEAAKRLYTSSGLLLNLADCHERLHRTATAWAEFGDAAFAAAGSGRTGDEAEAKRRQTALEASLSRLALHVDAPSPNELITRDGVPVDRAVWDSPIPVDPGEHVVVAEATGKLRWSASVTVTEPGKTVTVAVPALGQTVQPETSGSAVVTAVGAPTPDESTPKFLGNTQRVAGIVVGVAGMAAMGASGIMCIVAKSEYDTARAELGPARVSDSANAGKLADAATVVVAVGAAATIAGAIVWLTAPRAPVAVGTNGSGVFLAGSF